MSRKRKYELRIQGLGTYTFYAKDSEDALDFIFDEMLFEIEEERQMTPQEYWDNEADARHKEAC